MEQILLINACVRPNSRTLELTNHLLSHLDGEVTRVDLEQADIRPHTWQRLQRREELLSAGAVEDPMFCWANQFKQADTIVIAAPYYDLSFPASLKNYLECVANVGVTFYYDAQERPQTLCRAKRFFYVTTAGAAFVPDYGYGYVKYLFAEFYHIHEGHCFFADRLDLADSDPAKLLSLARDEIDHFFRNKGKGE